MGGINTIIHFSIYNILIISTGQLASAYLALFTCIAFFAANVNSYLLNKNWTFRPDTTPSDDGDSGTESLHQQTELGDELEVSDSQESHTAHSDSTANFATFFIVSIGGLIINVLLVYMINANSPVLFGLSELSPFSESITQKLWANVVLVCATIGTLIWNFIGYKLVVFKNQ